MEAHKSRFSEDGAMDFTPNPDKTLEAQVNKHIDAYLEELNSSQKPRDYLGGSRLGCECQRALYYEYSKTPKDEGRGFKGLTLRRFRMGHWCEEEVAFWLKGAGFDLRTHDKNNEQFGFVTAKGKIAGHIDGVLVNGPVKMTYPSLWENKVMKASKWKECDTKGIEKANHVYFVQMQVYCAYMGLDNWAFTAMNSDTSELLFQTGKARMDVAQWASDRGITVITSREARELPRITKDQNDYRCKFCDWAKRCWA